MLDHGDPKVADYAYDSFIWLSRVVCKLGFITQQAVVTLTTSHTPAKNEALHARHYAFVARL